MNSAEVWREIARRQREHGNSVGPHENAAGEECLLGSMDYTRISNSQRRAAERDFEQIVGSRPAVFNDQRSDSAQETLETAERVAEILEAREQPGVLSLSAARARRALPASQARWVSREWDAEPMEAAR